MIRKEKPALDGASRRADTSVATIGPNYSPEPLRSEGPELREDAKHGWMGLDVRPESIPESLKALNQWVAWKAKPNGERVEKIPIRALRGREMKKEETRTGRQPGNGQAGSYYGANFTCYYFPRSNKSRRLLPPKEITAALQGGRHAEQR